MSSQIQEIEDFELSLTSNPQGTIETADSNRSGKKSRKISPVHEHCRTPTPEEREAKAESKWIWCKYCPSHSSQNTTNMRQHLGSVHGIVASKAPESSIRMTATETVEELYTKLLLRLGDSKDNLDQEILRRTVNQQVIDQTLLDLIIIRRLPFSCVEWPEWHAFVKALNPQGHIFMPTSHNTIKQRIETWFPQAKDTVRKRLQSSQTNIHLAVDIWTSPSHDLLLAICSSFIDAQDHFHNILIAIRPVLGHSGSNQWETLRPVLQDYGIMEKIGILIGDNSTTNDVLCRKMANHLGVENQINWNQTHHRLRCMGHILNLIVNAFLFTNGSEEQLMELYDKEDESGEELDDKGQKERANSIRTKMGVMGKIHNLVVHIRASPNRTKEFEALNGRSIPLDNRTRWNSWFRMLSVALDTEVLNALRNYTEKHVTEGTIDKRDQLSPSDIALCRAIEQFLSVFHSATLFLEGQQATIERVLETMEIIKEHFKVSLVRQHYPMRLWNLLTFNRMETSSLKLELKMQRQNSTIMLLSWINRHTTPPLGSFIQNIVRLG
jgi:hypothetical protein